MLTLSKAIEETKRLAQGKNYTTAAYKVLRSMGFARPNNVTVHIARIVNDVGANENLSVFSAVMSELGKEGAIARAKVSKKSEQLDLILT